MGGAGAVRGVAAKARIAPQAADDINASVAAKARIAPQAADDINASVAAKARIAPQAADDISASVAAKALASDHGGFIGQPVEFAKALRRVLADTSHWVRPGAG
jgi:UDP-3-O-[3-hydroxymyristoyl] glucosamine N-acyltransferase